METREMMLCLASQVRKYRDVVITILPCILGYGGAGGRGGGRLRDIQMAGLDQLTLVKRF